MNQPLRRPDQPAERNGKTQDAAPCRRSQQIKEVWAGPAGRFGELHAGGDHRTARFALHLAQAGLQREYGLVLGQDFGGKYLILASRARSLRHARRTEPSPRPC
jgi:hypothetical protein